MSTQLEKPVVCLGILSGHLAIRSRQSSQLTFSWPFLVLIPCFPNNSERGAPGDFAGLTSRPVHSFHDAYFLHSDGPKWSSISIHSTMSSRCRVSYLPSAVISVLFCCAVDLGINAVFLTRDGHCVLVWAHYKADSIQQEQSQQFITRHSPGDQSLERSVEAQQSCATKSSNNKS
ncbi:hypothetical protein L228DRAFT_250082 [Xylona heveae TC161]|uniref:Uncharacterized protein n=1 Tax=Xylona heveae (strain CBS 132557 / TC161) TaxID=1328760 RepID=A0A165AFP1_XYLHT|nr:hypothetical protein L228DRAFT_250082 [Xylona heveae TC161]KZF20399.1 hypothetical protein L228DRAFT_250082 [Xylona heveae TC161]